jgi:prolipoprotein diacylglyceryltransferase
LLNIHFIFDILAYSLGAWLSWKVFIPPHQLFANENIRYSYYTALSIGVFLGAVSMASLNIYYSLSTDKIILGKSILGAIVGAIIAIEIFKKYLNIQGSTGAYFVPSLVIGIMIGRLGCFFSGLEDYTYGIETQIFLGYDFGDGVLRHPVQLYEAFAMAVFFSYVLYTYNTNILHFKKYIFYEFVLFYAFSRFIWEFLKPYASIFLGLNIFQIFCLGLIGYAIYYLRKEKYGTLFFKV